MKCKLVKIHELSGYGASIYSIVIGDNTKNLLDEFVEESSISFKGETIDILKRLRTIGKKTGARTQFFKLHEGVPGDGVCALFDIPGSNLRLYCIRYGTQLVVVGNGGHKPKSIQSLQEDDKLTETNYFLRELSSEITERIKEKDIQFINDDYDFIGDLEFEIQDL